MADNGVSVGGQEIDLPAPGANIQPFMRTHNLRYSTAVNDFPSGTGSPILE